MYTVVGMICSCQNSKQPISNVLKAHALCFIQRPWHICLLDWGTVSVNGSRGVACELLHTVTKLRISAPADGTLKVLRACCSTVLPERRS
jgi:hypothetical protein